MNKETIKKILDKLDFWLNEDKKMQNALGEWIKVIAPKSYVPIIETSLAQSYINGVCQANPELQDDLEYYAYELPPMEKAKGTRNGKEYNLKNKDEYVDFII